MAKSRVSALLAVALFAAAGAGLGALPTQPAAPAVQTAWEPSEADVLQVKMLSYLHFRDKGGPDVAFTRMTWYQNPPDAELPGIVVSLEYSMPLAGVGMRCGTLMWHRQSDGDFTLVRDLDKTFNGTGQQNTGSRSGCGQP